MDYPRVTEVLRYYTGYDNVPQNILDNASRRGRQVHALCAGLAKGEWIPDEIIDEAYQGYIKSFRQWSDAQVEKFPIIETRMNDGDFKYTGQIDFVVKGKDGELYLVDIKTSAKPQKTYPLQIAAYENLLRKFNIQVKGAFLVYLKKNGDFPDIHFMEDLTREFSVFLCALECWHYFNKKRKDDEL